MKGSNRDHYQYRTYPLICR